MVGRHYQLDGREFEQGPGVGDGQGCLACCIPRGHKESDTTEWLNRTFFHLVTKVIVAHFHLYHNSNCLMLDSAHPCHRPHALSTLHNSRCTHNLVYLNPPQILKCTLFFQACLLFPFSRTVPLRWWFCIRDSLPLTTQESLPLPSLGSYGIWHGSPLGNIFHFTMEWHPHSPLAVRFLQAGPVVALFHSKCSAHCLTLNRCPVTASQ